MTSPSFNEWRWLTGTEVRGQMITSQRSENTAFIEAAFRPAVRHPPPNQCHQIQRSRFRYFFPLSVCLLLSCTKVGGARRAGRIAGVRRQPAPGPTWVCDQFALVCQHLFFPERRLRASPVRPPRSLLLPTAGAEAASAVTHTTGCSAGEADQTQA